MPTKVETTVYTYKELVELHKQGSINGDALERAKQWLRECQVNHKWWDYAYEMWGKALTQIGFESSTINFSGFASQGDGASFTCDRVNCDKLLRFLAAKPVWSEAISGTNRASGGWTAEGGEDFRGFIVNQCNGKRTDPGFRRLLRYPDDLSADVFRTQGGGNYVHSNTCSFRVEWTGPDCLNDLVNYFENAAEELRKDLSQAIYKWLEQEYDELQSDEAIAELAEADEYTFTASGRRMG